ncbi:hypothetical protein CY35_16G087700, partial [Sphagnum magellanicum]
LCVFYTTLYVLLYNDGLPKISHILKLQEQLISHQNVGIELSNYNVEQDVLFQECFDTNISYMYSSVSGASKWCNKIIKRLNANQLKKMNKSYEHSSKYPKRTKKEEEYVCVNCSYLLL